MTANRIVQHGHFDLGADRRRVGSVTRVTGRRRTGIPGGFRRHALGAAVAAALAGGLMSPALAPARTVTWTGSAAFVSTDWLYAFNGFTNWLGNQQPANGDGLVFDGVLGLTNRNNGLDSIGDLSFAASAGAFTVNANALTVTGALTNNSSHAQVINGDLWAGASGNTWDGGSQGMTINGHLGLDDNSLTLTNKVTVNSDADLYVSWYERTTLTLLNGSSLTTSGGAQLGIYDSASGDLLVDGSGSQFNVGQTLWVGYLSNGTATIRNGGRLTSETSYLGLEAVDRYGIVTVQGAGSQWTNGSDLYVGGGYSGGSKERAGNGRLDILDGGLVSNGTFGVVGSFQGSFGTVNVEGSGSTWLNGASLLVGAQGTGTLNIRNGGLVKSTIGHVGNQSGGVGTVTVEGAGALWTNSGALLVGDSGTGTLDVRNGGRVTSFEGYIGSAPGAAGTVTVEGTNAQWVNSGTLNVGLQGTGMLNIRNGAMVSNSFGHIGRDNGATGTVTVEGIGSVWNNTANLSVAKSGVGILNIRDNGLVKASAITVGERGVLNLDGGTLRVASSVLAEGAKVHWTNGTLNYTGDASLGNGWYGMGLAQSLTTGQTLQVDGTMTVGAGTVLLLAGGQLLSGQLSLSGGAVVAPNGLNVSAAGNIVGHGTVAGAIGGGAGKLITASGGSLTLGDLAAPGGFVYDGTLNVGAHQVALLSAGKALLGSTTHLDEGGRLVTANGAELGNGETLTFTGNAGIQGDFTHNGAISGSGGALTFFNDVNGAGSFAGDIVFRAGYSPGNSPAAVSFNAGNASYGGTSVLTLEILGATPGGGHDQLVDIDHLSFEGNLQLVFGGGYVPVAGTRFSLFDFQSFSGTLSPGHIQVVGFDAARLDFSLLSANGTLSVAAVPEPETYALMLAGLVLTGWAARRGQHRAV